jgi:hypothetical protein
MHHDTHPLFDYCVLQVKVEKCGSTMWSEVPELAKLLREGNTKWEDLNLDDVDIRMKFAGLFHRGKRTPQRFMMRLKVRLLLRCLYVWTMVRIGGYASALSAVPLDLQS